MVKIGYISCVALLVKEVVTNPLCLGTVSRKKNTGVVCLCVCVCVGGGGWGGEECGGWGGVGGEVCYSRETSSLILMQLQITDICSVRIESSTCKTSQHHENMPI